jgi:hypothetical protein
MHVQVHDHRCHACRCMCKSVIMFRFQSIQIHHYHSRVGICSEAQGTSIYNHQTPTTRSSVVICDAKIDLMCGHIISKHRFAVCFRNNCFLLLTFKAHQPGRWALPDD